MTNLKWCRDAAVEIAKDFRLGSDCVTDIAGTIQTIFMRAEIGKCSIPADSRGNIVVDK